MRLPAGAVLLLSVSMAVLAQEVPLRAGLARVDITPAAFLPMAGYENRKCGPANGIHDPLHAKALLLEAGDHRVGIVTVDLISLVSERLRRDAADKLGISLLLVAAAHTHSGPALPRPGSSNSPASSPEQFAYFQEVERKIFSALEQASNNMFPARLGVGRGELQLGYNRLLLRDDGRARALFDNLERVPYGPVDPEYVILRIEDMNGTARAVLVHYACHAVVLGPTNCKYSADWPGVMQSRVEAEMPGTQCMFVQGAAGDINPLFMARSGKEDEDFAVVRKMGELMAGRVLKTARETRSPGANRHPIQFTSEVLRFGERWDKEKTVEVGIATVLINREIAIAAVPGEPLHKLQVMWKQQAEAPYPLFYGYTYSSGGVWPGYIPDLRSAAYGGYGADATTRIELGAGERIMQRHLINLYGLLGMWRDKPGRP